MKSFDMPVARWKDIERSVGGLLGEIEECRERFRQVERTLLRAVGQLADLDLGPPLDFTAYGGGPTSSLTSSAEYLVTSKKHSAGHSLSGHQDMRRRILDNYESLSPSVELLLEMHRNALGPGVPDAGEFKTEANFFPVYDHAGQWIASGLTIPVQELSSYLGHLHDRYHVLLDSETVHPLVLAAAYTFDIFRIHPFRDGNGRVTRLSLLLLLCRCGHLVARYVSIDGAIGKRRTTYFKAIMESESKWGTPDLDLIPWCSFVMTLVRDAYREMFVRTDYLSTTTRHLVNLSEAVASMPKSFGTGDVTTLVPGAPAALVPVVLNRMRRRGELQAKQSGGTIEWRKLI